MVVSALGFSVMTVHVKRLAPSLPGMELVFFRSFVNLLWVTALLVGRRQNPWPATDKPLLLFRGLAGSAGIVCMFYAISHLPLPIATMLTWSSPLFVILLSRVFLRERMPALSALFIPLAFAGLVLLLDPFSASGGVVSGLALLLGVLAAFFGGMAYVAVRAVTARVGPDVIVFYLVAASSLTSAPLMLAGFVRPSAWQALELFSMGSFAAVGQLAMTRAYRHAPAGVVSMMNLLNPVFGAAIGLFVFREAITAFQGLGILLVGIALAGLTAQGARSRAAAAAVAAQT
jgi:drug/metabolite transporter (DMT)-like permease